MLCGFFSVARLPAASTFWRYVDSLGINKATSVKSEDFCLEYAKGNQNTRHKAGQGRKTKSKMRSID
ncbi:MAG: hypothetical protein PVI06_20640 [Desulfobacterales bacterium]|jgi:hypothetical protein